MYAADLSTSCQVASGEHVRAIGWLEQGQPYPQAKADPRFRIALAKHVTDAGRWLAVMSFGIHRCDLGCGGTDAGTQYVVIPSATCVYIAPDLISHYVEAHAYAPPAEFQEAVRACPEQSSDEYIALLEPFTSTWRLRPGMVRDIALQMRDARVEAAAAEAERAKSRGNFKF